MLRCTFFFCAVCSLQDGVVKLEGTGRIVKGLKRELTELQPLLEAKALEAEGLLNQVCFVGPLGF